ncbi:co-chaperone GroES [Patescibacteria group bacterium]|nr:co-chaperone GroES [Patescibacteria group bacterium]MBU2219256.1 co-chaperone GroES [Patescibacteria group bacterium]
MAKIKPLHNNVLIEPISEESRLGGIKTKAGIIIPDTIDKEKPDQGMIIEVGPGKRDENGEIIPMSVKKGQKVIFSKYGPDEIKIPARNASHSDAGGGDKKFYIISEDNILAIYE